MANRFVQDVITGYCDPLLTQMGFCRKSRTWNRWLPNKICHVVELQLSKVTDKSWASFGLNFGVFEPRVFELCWGKVPAGFITESDCVARGRAGQLASDLYLKAAPKSWWIVESQKDLETVGKEVVASMTEVGIPFFDRVHSMEDIHRVLVTTYRQVDHPASQIYLAIIKAQLSDHEGALTLLNDFSAPRFNTWASRVAYVRGRLGLSEAAGTVGSHL